VEENRVKVLNVARPHASKKPDVGEFVMAVLDAVFGRLRWNVHSLFKFAKTSPPGEPALLSSVSWPRPQPAQLTIGRLEYQ
jgi:hypothetical protein